jgi:hypothetical protein
LIFDKLESGYSIVVAADEGVGRSATCQAAHCSEFAFWPNPQAQLAGLLQTVPTKNSEIIIESTPFGLNPFTASIGERKPARTNLKPVSYRGSRIRNTGATRRRTSIPTTMKRPSYRYTASTMPSWRFAERRSRSWGACRCSIRNMPRMRLPAF